MAVSILSRARVRAVTTDPFFATLMLGMQHVNTEKMPNGSPLWMAATDGHTLYFNETNLATLTLDQVVGVLKHELLHVAFGHNFRRGSRDPKKFNQAADYVINDVIIHEGGHLPDKILHDPTNWNRHMSAEEVYALMPDDPEGDKDNPLDDDVLPSPDQSSEAQAEVMGRVVQAAQVAKAVGRLPSYISAALGELLNPKIPWEQELVEFMTEASTSDYSYAKPNRRFVYQGLYLPSLYSTDSMGALALVFDTSGSVSMEEMSRFASEAVGAIEGTLPLSLHIIYCDSKVQHVDSFDAPTVDDVIESLHRYGSGGTDMTVALDHIDDHLEDIKACIVFTDGYTPFGHDREYPVLWAITSKGVEATMGRTIYVDL